MIISLGPRLPEASSDLTRGRWAGHPSLRRTGERPPIWSCSGWGLPCPLGRPRGGGLSPRLVTLTPGELKSRGGVFSVALSVPSRSLRVTEHPALRSSDFPLRQSRSDHPSHSGVRRYYKRPSTPIAILRRAKGKDLLHAGRAATRVNRRTACHGTGDLAILPPIL